MEDHGCVRGRFLEAVVGKEAGMRFFCALNFAGLYEEDFCETAGGVFDGIDVSWERQGGFCWVRGEKEEYIPRGTWNRPPGERV